MSSVTDNASTANAYRHVSGSKATNGPSMCDVWYAGELTCRSNAGAVYVHKTGTFEKNVAVWEVTGMATTATGAVYVAAVVNSGVSNTFYSTGSCEVRTRSAGTNRNSERTRSRSWRDELA